MKRRKLQKRWNSAGNKNKKKPRKKCNGIGEAMRGCNGIERRSLNDQQQHHDAMRQRCMVREPVVKPSAQDAVTPWLPIRFGYEGRDVQNSRIKNEQ